MRGRHRARHLTDLLFLVWIGSMTGIALCLLLVLAGTVAAHGVASFASAGAWRGAIPGGVWRGVAGALAGSLYIVGIGAIIAVPVGLGAGFYLSEYSGLWLTSFIRATADGLAGVPSIVAGLIVFATVVSAMGAFSALAGGLALATLLAPALTRATEQALIALPYGLREGARALGATRVQTLLRIVLPTAGRGLAARVLLALSRAMGETAPLLFTVFGAISGPHGLPGQVGALPLTVFAGALANNPAARAEAWSAALTMLLIVFALHVSARLFGRTGAQDAL